MTRTWVDSDLAEQPALLAVDARDLLPAGHAAFEFIETVKNFEMSEFAAAYRIDGVGRPPFDSKAMSAAVRPAIRESRCGQEIPCDRLCRTWRWAPSRQR